MRSLARSTALGLVLTFGALSACKPGNGNGGGTDAGANDLTLTFGTVPATLLEGESAVVTLLASGTRAADVMVTVNVDRVDDVQLATTTVVIPAGDAPYEAPITITAIDDLAVEPDETATLAIGPFASSDTAIAALTPMTRGLTILDGDDDADLAIDIEVTGTNQATTEGHGTVELTVSTTSPLSRSVVYEVSTTRPSEGVVSPATITFDADHTSHVLTVTGVDDAIDDGDVEYVVHVGPHMHAITNVDDDQAGIELGSLVGTLTEGVASTLSLQVALTSEPTAEVTVSVTANPSGRVTTTPPSLTFDATNWDVPQTIVLDDVDDDVAQGTQTIELTATTSSALDPVYGAGLEAMTSFSLVDPATPMVVAWNVTQDAISEEGGVALFRTTLSTEPTANVTIRYTVSNGTRAQMLDGSFAPVAEVVQVVTPADWNTWRSVFVRAIPGGSGSVSLDVTVDADASAGSGYESVTPLAIPLVLDARHSTTLMSRDGTAQFTTPSSLPDAIDHRRVAYLVDDRSGVAPVDSLADLVESTVDAPTSAATTGTWSTTADYVAPACMSTGECAYAETADRIASDTNGATDLYATPARRLGSHPGRYRDLAFQGEEVVFVHWESGESSEILVTDPTATTLVSVPPPSPWTASFVECAESDAANGIATFSCWLAGVGSQQVFVRDLSTGITSLVSHDTTGAAPFQNSYGPAISANGRYIAFFSNAALIPEDSNVGESLYVYDRQTDSFRVFGTSFGYGGGLRIVSTISRIRVAWYTAGSPSQIAMLDPATGYSAIVSRAGVAGRDVANASCFEPSIEPGARYVYASCTATNLVDLDGDGAADDDTNGVEDVFRFPMP